MTIRFKMLATVVVVTLLLMTLGGVVHWQVVAFEVLAASRVQIGEVDRHLLQMRRNEKDFLARLDTQYVDRFEEDRRELVEHIGELEKLLSHSSIGSSVIDEVRNGLETYTRLFAQVVELQRNIGRRGG